MVLERCQWCGAELETVGSPANDLVESSPSCWSTFNALTSRVNSEFGYRSGLVRLINDSYCAQHPGKESRASSNSVAIHTIGLILVLELGYNGRVATKRMEGILRGREVYFTWLEPPSFDGCLNLTHMLGTKESDRDRVKGRKMGTCGAQGMGDRHGDRIDALL